MFSYLKLQGTTMTISPSAKNALTLAAVCLASLMFGLEISSIPVILPTLETVLLSDFKELQWIMNAYTLACTAILMAIGTLADRYGRKRLFVVSLMLFSVTTLVCGLATNTSVLIAGRFLQGMAGGAMLICQIAVLSNQFTESGARGKAFGSWGIVFGLGLGFGPIIGAAIVAISSWEWVFLVHVPIAIIALALVFMGVEESSDPQKRSLDVKGIIFLSLSVFGLVWYITQAPTLGFISPVAITLLGATLLCLVIFIMAERSNSAPMFDFSVFRIRRFSGALLGSVGMNFSFWPFMIYIPLYFQNVLGYSNVAAGLSLLAYTLPTLVFPPVGEKLSLRYRAEVVIPAGLFTIGAGFLLMKWGSSLESASWLTMLPGCLLAGIGLGITNTPVTNTTTGSVANERAGMASGIDISARMISLAINIALMGFILVEGISDYLRSTLSGATDFTQLRQLAEGLSAGNITMMEQITPVMNISSTTVQGALSQGFGWVMIYGSVSVWILAICSFLIFKENGVKIPGSGDWK